jgi:hypothetical protein
LKAGPERRGGTDIAAEKQNGRRGDRSGDFWATLLRLLFRLELATACLGRTQPPFPNIWRGLLLDIRLGCFL